MSIGGTKYPGDLTSKDLADIRLRAFEKIAELCNGGVGWQAVVEEANMVADWAATGTYPDKEDWTR